MIRVSGRRGARPDLRGNQHAHDLLHIGRLHALGPGASRPCPDQARGGRCLRPGNLSGQRQRFGPLPTAVLSGYEFQSGLQRRRVPEPRHRPQRLAVRAGVPTRLDRGSWRGCRIGRVPLWLAGRQPRSRDCRLCHSGGLGRRRHHPAIPIPAHLRARAWAHVRAGPQLAHARPNGLGHDRTAGWQSRR